MNTQLRISDRIFAVLWALVLIWYGYTATGFEAEFSYEPVGPRAFPLLLTLLMAICVGWMLVKPDPEPRWPERPLAIKLGIMILVLAVYGAFFNDLGFIVATVLMTLVVARLYDGSWIGGAVAGVGLSAGLYVMFEYLLDVALPTGTLFGG